jgi:hypothetical protein
MTIMTPITQSGEISFIQELVNDVVELFGPEGVYGFETLMMMSDAEVAATGKKRHELALEMISRASATVH